MPYRWGGKKGERRKERGRGTDKGRVRHVEKCFLNDTKAPPSPSFLLPKILSLLTRPLVAPPCLSPLSRYFVVASFLVLSVSFLPSVALPTLLLVHKNLWGRSFHLIYLITILAPLLFLIKIIDHKSGF